MRVKLSEIIDAIEMTNDETHFYLNTQTGEIEAVLDFDVNNFGEQVDENFDRYLALPTENDIDDHQIMADFVATLPAGVQQTQLASVIQRRSAFRHFREDADKFGLTSQWYAFRDNAYQKIAMNWCNENGIEYSKA
ncbi:UPF0158 family protein [Lacticaseibacillus hulanensis]|uniref:UPF0158 family protein n=1 Tax=Lacticaseibacillus hulanensis TaxID=2493111 RepID=UPI000FD76F01|nr:UPF0158 family protein [Lacticaseibacillus hulanensis]